MNTNNLKNKFNDFQPSPQPGDWEKMEELLENPSIRFGFLASFLTAVLASGALLALFAYKVQPSPLATMNTSVEIVENSIDVKDHMKTNEMTNKDENNQSREKTYTEESSLSQSTTLSSTTLYTTNLEKGIGINTKDSQNKRIGDVSFNSTKDKILEEEDTIEDYYRLNTIITDSRSTEEELAPLPLNVASSINSQLSINLTSNSFIKKSNLYFLELCFTNSSPRILSESIIEFNYLASLGAKFHMNDWNIGTKVGVSNLTIPSIFNDNYRLDQTSNFEMDVVPHHLEKFQTVHSELTVGHSFRLSRRVTIQPFVGITGIFYQQQYTITEFESSIPNLVEPDPIGTDSYEVSGTFIFLQSGFSIAYNINPRWSLFSEISYQHSLNNRSLKMVVPGVGLSYRLKM